MSEQFGHQITEYLFKPNQIKTFQYMDSLELLP